MQSMFHLLYFVFTIRNFCWHWKHITQAAQADRSQFFFTCCCKFSGSAVNSVELLRLRNTLTQKTYPGFVVKPIAKPHLPPPLFTLPIAFFPHHLYFFASLPVFFTLYLCVPPLLHSVVDLVLPCSISPTSPSPLLRALLYGPASPVWCAGELAPPETRACEKKGPAV